MNKILGESSAPATGMPDCNKVLSYSDMMPRTIFISHDGKRLVSAIDWEMAGYYPDFYEVFKYLHRFKYEDSRESKFTERWLQIFWTETARLVGRLEGNIRNDYCNASPLRQQP